MKMLVKVVICIAFAEIGSRAVFAAFGFEYHLFTDPFDVTKLVIDLGVFIALFLLASWLLAFVPFFAGKGGD